MENADGRSQLKTLIHLTWPILIEMLLHILVGNVDQLMIANYSQEAVGGIANANQILTSFILVFSMISTATTIMVTQYKGVQDEAKVAVIYSVSLVMNFVLGAVLGGVIVLLADPFFRMIHTPDVFLSAANTYIRMTGGPILIQALFSTYSAIFRSNRMMKTSMVVSVLTNVMNMIGNAVLIYGLGPFPELGVTGAALSTNLSRLSGLAVMAFLFHTRMHGRVRKSHFTPFPRRILFQLIGIGIPSGGESFSFNMTQIVVLTFVNGFGADSTMAFSYSKTVASFTILFCISLSQALQVMVGYHVGAGKYDRAREITTLATRCSMALTLFLSILVFFLSDALFSLFQASLSVKAICHTLMFLDIFHQFGRSYNLLYLRALQGAGDVRYPTMIGIISTWVLVVGGGYVFSVLCGLGLNGIWLAMILDECLRGLVFLIRWRRGTWKSKSLVSSQKPEAQV